MGEREQPPTRWVAIAAHRDYLVRLARRKGAGADAEDVASEAIIRAYTQPALDVSRARAYLAKIASNMVIDLRRLASRDRLLHTHAALAPRPGAATDEVDDRALARYAERLVDQLDGDVRQIIRWRGEGESWRQIATRLGQRKETVEMRYRRAITPVRRHLTR